MSTAPVDKHTISKTVGAAGAGLLGTLALLGMLFANEGPKQTTAPAAPAAEGEASPDDLPPRIQLLVFEKTPVGDVLLEKPDHGGGLRPVMPARQATLSLKVTNEGERPYEKLSVLVVNADATVTWLMRSADAPTGVDQTLATPAPIGPTAGRYAVLALFSRRALTDGELDRPLAQLRRARADGRLLVPSFGSKDVAELRQEIDLSAPR